MTQIFNYISYNDVIHIDNYNNTKISLFIFDNIKFRTYNLDYINFQVQLGIDNNNKIISLTNKQISFLVQKYFHFLGDNYAKELKNNYEILKNVKNEEIIEINDEVFQFFDYESVNSTSHSYDLMFYLLYYYKMNNLKSKLIVVESNNKYYNSTLELIKLYFDVEYIYIKPYKTYLFKKFSCIRSYQNIFFNEVKDFININLIQQIISKYERINEKYYDNIIKIKYENPNIIDRLNISFKKTELFTEFCKNKNVFDLNDIDDNEELKIYLLNKAKIIRINWGSSYFININYYLQNTNNKLLSVIFHKNIIPEMDQVSYQDNIFSQNTNYIKNLHVEESVYTDIKNSVYNNWNFKGEVISNITNIDEYILRTKI
jgi:hypothetical protein